VAIDFDPNTPIYLQIMQLIRRAVASGLWTPGGKVPSVRDLAIEYGVNPNTVQRALSELERDGLLFSERTSGRFITIDRKLLDKLRSDLADSQIQIFLEQMTAVGYSKSQILEMLRQKWSESDAHH
jgi:GntR family transcriptional regulator